MKYVLYTNITAVKVLLHYLYTLVESSKEGERSIISPYDIIYFNRYCDVSSTIKTLKHLYILGSGTYTIPYENDVLNVCIKNFIDDKKMLHSYSPGGDVVFVKQVDIECESQETFDKLVEKSEALQKQLKIEYINDKGDLKKYIYDAKDAYWSEAPSTSYRDIGSLFLKEGEKERLFSYIDDFINTDTKADYFRFNIPYKSNILLYGKPGTGKTSTILTVASHLKTNIGLIPITQSLDDSGLITALNGVKKNKCQVVVIEDIDCLFCDRKKHDSERNNITLSGLLNCMDGLFRAEGIIVFLTTNKIDELDEALVRSARIDFKMEYTYANEYQINNCFEYYFPLQKAHFDKFYEKVATKNYTIADFQVFFFKHRKCNNILDHLKDLFEMTKAKENSNSLYM